MKSSFTVGNATDVGRARKRNEDYYGSYTGAYGTLLVVCDGVGGHEGGEVASRLAVEAIREHFSALPAAYDVRAELRAALLLAHKRLVSFVGASHHLQGMGSTAVVALLRNDTACVAHVGDSRAYLLRRGQLHQLTKDHSFVQRMVDAAVITPGEALRHPQRNVLMQVLGGGKATVEPEITGPLSLFRGDTLVLCTDGLFNHVETAEIQSVLSSTRPQEACAELVTRANQRGGGDNITVQVVRVERGVPYRVQVLPRARTVRRALAATAGVAAIASLVVFLRSPGGEETATKTLQEGERHPPQTAQGGGQRTLPTVPGGSGDSVTARRRPGDTTSMGPALPSKGKKEDQGQHTRGATTPPVRHPSP